MEYEVKVLDINPLQIRKKLLSMGCKKVHNPKMMKRVVFNLCDNKIDGFARVRDEGSGITMTSKIYKDKDFPEETEVSINETYEIACNFVESLGLTKKSVQESIREKWSHPLAHEITIDSIPGIPTYMEIDCTTKHNLDKLIEMLDIDRSKIRTGGYDKQFNEYYGINKEEFSKIKFITFRNVKNEIKPLQNKELLETVASNYTDKFLKAAEKPIKNLHATKGKRTKLRCPNGTRKKCIKR